MNKKIVYQYPQYGFGSWLKENAGGVGTIVGSGLGMLIGNPMLGASIGGSIGGAVQQKNAMEVANQEQADLLAKQTGIQTALTNAQNMNLPTYGANFANGGKLTKQSSRADSIVSANPYLNAITTVNSPLKSYKVNTSNMTVNELKSMIDYLASKRVGITTNYTGELQNKLLDKNSSTISAYNELLKNKFTVNGNPVDVDAITYANGGNLNFKSPAAYKAWLAYGHASGEFAKTPGHQKVSIKGRPKKVQHAMGGLIDSLACGGKLKAMGGTLEASDKLDGITLYQNGGTHSENNLGGIPVGNKGRVEEGEVRFGNYVFSNRF